MINNVWMIILLLLVIVTIIVLSVTLPAKTAATSAALPSLSITYVGQTIGTMIFPFVAGITQFPKGGSGTVQAISVSGPVVQSFTFINEPFITSITFNDLAGTFNNFSPTGAEMPLLTNLAAPAFMYSGGNYGPQALLNLTSMTAPQLTATLGFFNPNTLPGITTLSFLALRTVSLGFIPTVLNAVTTFSFPLLQTVGSFAPATMATLTDMSLPSLQYVVGAFSVSTMASLTTVSCPAMIYYGSTITMNSSLGQLTNITLGTNGTLHAILGATINITGQTLNSASVNALLSLLVSLDGTAATTLWGAGQSLNISGGTNAAPSGQGITDKATLVGRGATITTN